MKASKMTEYEAISPDDREFSRFRAHDCEKPEEKNHDDSVAVEQTDRARKYRHLPIYGEFSTAR